MRHTIVHEVIALPTEISYNDGIKIIMQSQHMIGVFLSLLVTNLDMQQHIFSQPSIISSDLVTKF